MPIFYLPPPPQPPRVELIQPSTGDQPPRTRQALTALLGIVLRCWEPLPPQPQQAAWLSPGIPGQSIDAPPLRQSRGDLQARAWQPGPPAPQQGGLLSPGIPGRSIDAPPGVLPRAEVQRRAWDPPAPAPVQQTPTVPVPEVVTSDDPPFTQSRRDRSPIVAWYAPVPLPVTRGPVFPILAVVISDAPPPTRQAGTQRAILAWHVPPLPLPQQGGLLSPGIPGQSIDAPPVPAPRATLQVRAWQPGPPLPPQAGPLPPGLPGQSMDAPPVRRQDARGQPLLWLWQLPTPWPRQRPVALVPIPPPVVPGDAPPFAQRGRQQQPVWVWHLPPIPRQPRHRQLPGALLDNPFGPDGFTGGVSSATVTAMAGGSLLEVIGLALEGYRVRGVTSELLASFGTSAGLTALVIGDPVLNDRWGRQDTLTLGARTNQLNAHSGSEPIAGPGGYVLQVAVEGGLMDSTGRIKLTVFWERLTADIV